MGFVPRALIDHAALRHNLKKVRELAPQSKVWAVIKANAYGHGLQRVAQTLQATDGFALARIDEALRLRKLGVDKPLLVLEGVFNVEDAQAAIEADCQLCVHHQHQVEVLEKILSGGSTTVWLKLDTGMHRLGFRIDEAGSVIDRLRNCPMVGELNLMTHLANADDRSDPTTQGQLDALSAVPLGSFTAVSIANSAGLIGYPTSRRDWVRPGIMLYGVSPFLETTAQELDLRPVMTFTSQVIAINHYRKGDRIGYGGIFACPEDMRLAVVGVGYGDGYPRHATSGTPVLVRNRRLPLVGRVSMDMLTIDTRNLPDIRIGDTVTLWGEGLPVEEIASAAGTIGYELLCGITGRVEFVDRNDN
jgi:alanine racemase